MNVTLVSETTRAELKEKMRAVPLMSKDANAPKRFPYADADISVRTVNPTSDEVAATTFYVLRKGLQTQADLRESLMDEYSIDTLRLDRLFEVQNGDNVWGLMPPLVEVVRRVVRYVPEDGQLEYPSSVRAPIPAVADGAHRVFMARSLNVPVSVVHVANIPLDFPFYAHPNPWDQVKVVDEVPKDKIEKKMYLLKDCYALYRDLGVLGCGAPRTRVDMGPTETVKSFGSKVEKI